MTIKTFRGLIGDDGQDTIVLHTNDGSTGYRIVKFQIMPEKPGSTDHRFVVKIYKIEQAANIRGGTNLFSIIDFSDNTLLGAGDVSDNAASHYPTSTHGIIFDGETFNQDIYVTCVDLDTGESCNYYIELEQMRLDLSENTVATLKDIRNITAPT